MPKNVRLETGPRWDVSYRELNIIGQRAEEAVEQVDKFLDSAALASVNRVRIVHGHGMGMLKKAVGELLVRIRTSAASILRRRPKAAPERLSSSCANR